MTSVIVLLVIMVVLFGVLFLTKRRLGVPVLALAAGAILSELWVGELTPMVARAGVHMTHPPLDTAIAFIAVIIPALLVLFGGMKVHSVWARVVAGVVFATVAAALLHDILVAALVIEGPGRQLFALLGQYKVMIITFGLLVAIGDVMALKMPKLPRKH